jgi:hypothetical protein
LQLKPIYDNIDTQEKNPDTSKNAKDDSPFLNAAHNKKNDPDNYPHYENVFIHRFPKQELE